MDTLEAIQDIAKAGNGKINEVGILPDNSGFATISFPLPNTHWIYESSDAPPMPFKLGTGESCVFAAQNQGVMPDIMSRDEVANKIREAGKYAIRGATMSGKYMDFDPDALLQNLVVGLLGYWTPNGLTSTEDDWMNPPRFRQGGK